MAEPKKKLSKTRTHIRRSRYTVGTVAVILCSNCKEPIRPHMICPHCGYYQGKPTRLAKIKRLTAAEPEKDTEK